MLENDTEYLRAVAVSDLAKARGLENMDRLIVREPIYEAMVYVWDLFFVIQYFVNVIKQLNWINFQRNR